MSLEDRAAKLIESRHLLWGVGFVSFLESIVLPLPLEAVLIPAMQSRRDRLWQLAGVALLGCIAGAVAGYGAGYFTFEAVGQHLIRWLSSPQEFARIRQETVQQGFWFVLSVGVTPVPFQIAMLAAGATAFSLPLFLAATGLARALRYFGLAVLVWKFGERAESVFRCHKVATGLVITAVVVVGWWLTLR
jgi:membrane protein YqaA with SNARE-associated domain